MVNWGKEKVRFFLNPLSIACYVITEKVVGLSPRELISGQKFPTVFTMKGGCASEISTYCFISTNQGFGSEINSRIPDDDFWCRAFGFFMGYYCETI